METDKEIFLRHFGGSEPAQTEKEIEAYAKHYERAWGRISARLLAEAVLFNLPKDL